MTNYGAIKLSADTVYYHITHWKAGSQWFRAVLKAAFKSNVVESEEGLGHLAPRPPQPGRIYPCCYLARSDYKAHKPPGKARCMVVIRDLRDTLISGYFSLRNSHNENEWITKQRGILKAFTVEEALIHLMDEWLLASAAIQRSWVQDGEPIARLEDFMSKPADALQAALSAGWGVQISSGQARKLMRHHSFERYSLGRKPGQEDVAAHYRKGVRGDWRTYFTPRVVAEFKVRYNDVLLKSGYETSPDW